MALKVSLDLLFSRLKNPSSLSLSSQEDVPAFRASLWAPLDPLQQFHAHLVLGAPVLGTVSQVRSHKNRVQRQNDKVWCSPGYSRLIITNPSPLVLSSFPRGATTSSGFPGRAEMSWPSRRSQHLLPCPAVTAGYSTSLLDVTAPPHCKTGF